MEELERLLQDKLRLLKDVHAETDKQSGFIARQDSEGLLKSVADRQARMDEIDALEARIGGNAHAGQAVSRLRDEIAAELRDIIRKDDENRRNAGGMAGELVSGIRESNTAKTLKAYQSPHGAGYRYVNKKG